MGILENMQRSFGEAPNDAQNRFVTGLFYKAPDGNVLKCVSVQEDGLGVGLENVGGEVLDIVTGGKAPHVLGYSFSTATF